MADKKISELTAVVSLAGTELMEVVQGGVNKQTTAQDIADLAGGGTSIPFGATTGTSTLTATMTPTVTSYANGALYTIRMGATTIGNSTLNIDSVGAKKIYETPERQISINDLVQGRSYLVQYDTALDAAAGGFVVIGEVSHEELMYRDLFDASGNAFPTTGGTGYAGAIRVGDLWVISVSGTLDGVAVSPGDVIIALSGGATISGWILLYGYASIIGVQDLFFPADSFGPRVTSGCGPAEVFEMATSLANIVALPFDQTTQEYAQCRITPPRKWNGGTITVVPYWTATSGSGTVRWAINGGMYRNDDALTTAFGTAQNSDDTLLATNDLHAGPATSAITLSGTHADGAYVILQVSRDPTNDTLNADALFMGLSVRFTTNSPKDA